MHVQASSQASASARACIGVAEHWACQCICVVTALRLHSCARALRSTRTMIHPTHTSVCVHGTANANSPRTPRNHSASAQTPPSKSALLKSGGAITPSVSSETRKVTFSASPVSVVEYPRGLVYTPCMFFFRACLHTNEEQSCTTCKPCVRMRCALHRRAYVTVFASAHPCARTNQRA